MKLHGAHHVYTVVPPWPGNRDLPVKERIEFDLEGVSQKDIDEREILRANQVVEQGEKEVTTIYLKSDFEMLRRKFKAVRNLVVDDKPVTDFDDFYARAPRELVTWVVNAIQSTEKLLEAEAKNFEPGSGSGSTTGKTPAS